MVLDNKQKLLIGLAVVLVLTLSYRLANPIRQPTVAKLTYGRTNRVGAGPANQAGGDALSPPTKIKTSLLATPTPIEPGGQRDPFRRPAPKVTNRPPEAEPQTPEPRALTPNERAKEKLGRFKAFGAFSQGDRTSLFLQRGKQVLVVTVGDRIDGRFTVEAIDGLSVLVTTPESPEGFRFDFEELPTDESRPFARSSGSAGGLSPSRTIGDAAPGESEAPFPAADEIEETFPEAEEDRPPPDLPEPPPIDSPTQPFRSSGSPSRSYLPGTKPPDTNQPEEPTTE